VKRDGDGIEIFLDRERGGVWWSPYKNPTLRVKFDCPLVDDRKIRIEACGGDLKEPVQIGEVPLLPPPKPIE